MFRNGQKQTKKCKMCSTYGSSWRRHDKACRINEVLVLVFNSMAVSSVVKLSYHHFSKVFSKS